VHLNGSEVVVEDPLADQLDLASFNEYAGWYWSNNRDMLNFRFNIRYRKPVVITSSARRAGRLPRRRRHPLERGVPATAVRKPDQDARAIPACAA